MRLDTLSAVAASALVWLVAWPTVASDKETDKTDLAVFAICRAGQHVEITGGNPTIAIESGMGTGGFAVGTASPSAQA